MNFIKLLIIRRSHVVLKKLKDIVDISKKYLSNFITKRDTNSSVSVIVQDNNKIVISTRNGVTKIKVNNNLYEEVRNE